jgi:hypothetical protein
MTTTPPKEKAAPRQGDGNKQNTGQYKTSVSEKQGRNIRRTKRAKELRHATLMLRSCGWALVRADQIRGSRRLDEVLVIYRRFHDAVSMLVYEEAGQ